MRDTANDEEALDAARAGLPVALDGPLGTLLVRATQTNARGASSPPPTRWSAGGARGRDGRAGREPRALGARARRPRAHGRAPVQGRGRRPGAAGSDHAHRGRHDDEPARRPTNPRRRLGRRDLLPRPPFAHLCRRGNGGRDAGARRLARPPVVDENREAAGTTAAAPPPWAASSCAEPRPRICRRPPRRAFHRPHRRQLRPPRSLRKRRRRPRPRPATAPPPASGQRRPMRQDRPQRPRRTRGSRRRRTVTPRGGPRPWPPRSSFNVRPGASPTSTAKRAAAAGAASRSRCRSARTRSKPAGSTIASNATSESVRARLRS